MSQYLFSSIDELKAHIPVAYTTLGIEDEKPFILLAQETYLKPVLGEQLYDQLLDMVDPDGDSGSGSGSGSGGVSDGLLEQLRDKCRPAVAMLAYYEGLPFLEVKISKQGIHQVSGDELKPIFSTQRQRLESALLKLGYNALEQVVVWLEKKKSGFGVWTQSTAYTEYKGRFVESAARFTELWGKVDNKRLTYVALKSVMDEVERSEVQNILGTGLYTQLKAQLVAGNVGVANAVLLPMIRPLVAYRTAADAMPYLSMSIEAYGVFSQSIYSNERNVQAFERPDAARFAQELEQLQSKANSYAAKLKKYLNENVDDYPLFESSDAYDADHTETGGSIDDQDDLGIVMF